VASVELIDSFNKQVEADLMFYQQYFIFHMIDRCTRWYHSVEVSSTEEEELINAIDRWYRIHGPPTELIMDQETAIYRSAKARDYFHRKGIKRVPRATGQQVAYIDRRGALAREVINTLVTQLQTEGT
jgi:hypothetical protein